MYTALVELIAHEVRPSSSCKGHHPPSITDLIGPQFIFNPYWQAASLGKLCYALSCFGLGAGCMALLGKWA